MYIKISIKSITPPKYIRSIAFPNAPAAIDDRAIATIFFSENIDIKNIELPTSIEKVLKKYRPKIPPSLKKPKLIPVFLTKTIFKKATHFGL